jgi:hypothetical protein
MKIRRVVASGALLVAVVALAPLAAGQRGALQAGTVTATIDGKPFTANVSIATLADGKLVLTNLSNLVQMQIPNARVGKFEIKLDADGGQVDVILGFKVGRTFISPVSGWITIESLSATAATGRFECTAKDLATGKSVTVTEGRFAVKMTGK